MSCCCESRIANNRIVSGVGVEYRGEGVGVTTVIGLDLNGVAVEVEVRDRGSGTGSDGAGGFGVGGGGGGWCASAADVSSWQCCRAVACTRRNSSRSCLIRTIIKVSEVTGKKFCIVQVIAPTRRKSMMGLR